MKTITEAVAASINSISEPVSLADRPGAASACPGQKPETNSPQNTSQKPSASDKARLALALSRVCALQHQYGKTQAELETLVEGFCWVLGEYPMDVILAALATYVKTARDIPAPADLVKIIDPPTPPLSAAVYVKYQRMAGEGQYLLSDERAFCRAFEAQEEAKVRGGSDELREARRQIDSAKLLECDQ